MKEYLRFFSKALPLTIGTALTLIALCFLVEFYDRGLDLDDKEFWAFILFFILGFPLLAWGVQHLSTYTPKK